MDDFILAMCERQRQEDVKTVEKELNNAFPAVAELGEKGTSRCTRNCKKGGSCPQEKKVILDNQRTNLYG